MKPHPPHPKLRKTIKWVRGGGAAVTVLLVVVWIGSGWYGGNIRLSDRVFAGAVAGRLWVGVWTPAPDLLPPRFNLVRLPEFYMRWGFERRTRTFALSDSATSVGIPLWAPTAVCLIITAAAWRLDILARRRLSRVRHWADAMKPHPRIRKTIKWGGAAVTALLVVVWIGSGWYAGRFQLGDRVHAGAGWGRLGVSVWPPGPDPLLPGFELGRLPEFHMGWGFAWRTLTLAPPATATYVYIPLWAPTAVCLIITAAAWRLDILARRRARLDLCSKCNYDRTGLSPAAVCPECGTGPTP